MTSAITPGTIDTTYPVAGQDNDSQGFRDNFTNIKTNFQRAADEITDLQSKVLLTAPLTGGTPVTNNLLGNPLTAAKLFDARIAWVNHGSTSGSVSMNYTQGQYHSLSTSGAVQLVFTNIPAATTGSAAFITVRIEVTSVAHTVTFPAAATINAQGIQGLNTSTNVMTFAAVGTYTFQFVTTDGGTTLVISEVNKRVQPFNNSSEDLAASAAANLAVTTSYFTTTTSESATLAEGVEGQIKVFAMREDGGDMVITVTNAGWKTSGSGTITFDDIGDACVLQYISSKWFCIGNNGCTFA